MEKKKVDVRQALATEAIRQGHFSINLGDMYNFVKHHSFPNIMCLS